MSLIGLYQPDDMVCGRLHRPALSLAELASAWFWQNQVGALLDGDVVSGYLTAASGSFAALRDLADLRATLLFDDAEVLADSQKADPDKQMLILAGNRKGVCIPVKEQGTDRRWHTRWLNAYCPRGFTSLRLPFQALQVDQS